MPQGPLIVVLDSQAHGQGKSTIAMQLVEDLRKRGRRVGGFTLMPVYRKTSSGSRLVGYDAIRLADGSKIRLADARRTDWTLVDIQRHKGVTIPERHGDQGTFYVNEKALEELMTATLEEIQSPLVDAIVFDDVGHVTILPHRRHRSHRNAIEQLLEAWLSKPKPENVVVLAARHIKLPTMESLRERLKTMKKNATVHISDLNPNTFRIEGDLLVAKMHEHAGLR